MDGRSLTKSPSGHVSRRHRTSEPFSRRYRKSERIEPECNTDDCSYQNGIDDRTPSGIARTHCGSSSCRHNARSPTRKHDQALRRDM